MPVYNQERVLQQTLQSIAAQTLQSFELICVDDGSTDGSVRIECAFRDADSRMRLFLREHEGAASARNFGLGQARGAFVIFLDSDDLFHPDFLLDMASVLEGSGADVCVCEADYFYGDPSSLQGYIRLPRECEEGLYHHGELGIYTFRIGEGYAWSKMFRRALLEHTGALFQEIVVYEDCRFVAKAIWEAESVYLLKKTLVYYRCGLGTSLTDTRMRHPFDALAAAEEMFDDLYVPSCFSAEEAASLRYKCSDLLLLSVKNALLVGEYDDIARNRVIGDLQRWSVERIPLRANNIEAKLQFWMLRHATCNGVEWVYANWSLEKRLQGHSRMQRVGLIARIFAAVVLQDRVPN